MSKLGRRVRRPDMHPNGAGIVLFDAHIRFAPLRGVVIPEWRLALLAAAALKRDFKHSGPVLLPGPPPVKHVGGARFRRQPVNKSLANGYNEITLEHISSPERTYYFLRLAADRIRKARKQWRMRPASRRLLSKSSYSLAKKIYPDIPKSNLYAQHLATR